MLESYRFAYRFPWIDGDGAPFDVTFDVDSNPSLHKILCGRGAFSADECRRIVEIGEQRPREGAGVHDYAGGDAGRVRACEVAWLDPRPDTEWLYRKLGDLFAEVNAEYEFELLGLAHAPQYTIYGKGQHFTWHPTSARARMPCASCR